MAPRLTPTPVESALVLPLGEAATRKKYGQQLQRMVPTSRPGLCKKTWGLAFFCVVTCAPMVACLASRSPTNSDVWFCEPESLNF